MSRGQVSTVMIASKAEHELWMSRRALREGSGLKISVEELETGKIIHDDTLNRIAVTSDLRGLFNHNNQALPKLELN